MLYLKKQIPKLLFQVISISGLLKDINTSDNLGSLLNTLRLKAYMCLCPVPLAAILTPKSLNNIL